MFIRTFEVGDPKDLEKAFATAVEEKAGGLVVQNYSLFLNRAEYLASLAFRFRMPTIYEERENVQAGGLISYGASRRERLRSIVYQVCLREESSSKPVDCWLMDRTLQK